MHAQTNALEDFNRSLDLWLEQLENYNFSQLTIKPSPTSWSMGQLYVHLVQATRYSIKQMKTAASNNDNTGEEAFDSAKRIFLSNEFPDALIEGPPSNAKTPQPESKEQLKEELSGLKDEIKVAYELASQSQFNGKTKHFGLGFLSAKEWLQFAAMHLRHHLRHKKRLDDFLKKQSSMAS